MTCGQQERVQREVKLTVSERGLGCIVIVSTVVVGMTSSELSPSHGEWIQIGLD